ncbi:MAG: cyclic nucleotide-binding domain-containing protein [Spirochaetales bacterium]|nr:cyclic nucleotide-binding domain-containing protein [Spirochaetales bacterium]
MGLIGIINKDRDVKRLFENLKETNSAGGYEFAYLRSEEEAVNFLNNELPHLIVVNFTDLQLNISGIMEKIAGDDWLYDFGIIALYHKDEISEEELEEQYGDYNIILALTYEQINSDLIPPLKLIDKNCQLVLQKPLSSTLTGDSAGSFIIGNNLDNLYLYTRILVHSLAKDGLVERSRSQQVQSALIELLTNAIEHGNCRISFEEREKARERGMEANELVSIKNQNTLYRTRKVTLSWEKRENRLYIKITDEGDGFNTDRLNLELANDAPLSVHGGGIAMANMIADDLFYNKKGTCATMVLDLNEEEEDRPIPEGFMNEEILVVNPGDVVIEEGSFSDSLYYISRGTFSVYAGNKKVARLDGSDVFMGEMAFLMNSTRSASVVADTPARLVKITRDAFLNVLRDYPHYGIYLSRLLAQRLDRANKLNFQLKKEMAGKKDEPVGAS